MWFIVVGCVLLGMKVADMGFAASWPWWSALLPFGLAMVWWAISDSLGLTQKREIQKMEDRKQERRRRNMEALGLNWRRDKRVAVIRNQARVESALAEPKAKVASKAEPEAKPSRTKPSDHTTEVSSFQLSRQYPSDAARDGH
jgi:small Trp-rich protein